MISAPPRAHPVPIRACALYAVVGIGQVDPCDVMLHTEAVIRIGPLKTV